MGAVSVWARTQEANRVERQRVDAFGWFGGY